MKTENFVIRDGKPEDIPEVFVLIRELAKYENALEEVENTVEQLIADGFGPNPLFGLLVAELDGNIIGISLYYFRYSTWKGKRLYLEDIIISENERSKGYGSALFQATIRKSVTLNCSGMTWAVLNWNKIGIDFYKKYEAMFDDEWVITNLSREKINKILANEKTSNVH